MKTILIRPSRDDDLPAIAALYGHHVRHGTGTFETEPPTVAEMAARRADVLAKGLPWLVAEVDGAVAGFAYGNWFKPRPAYRYSVEDSIYVAPQALGRGLGRALLAELLAQLEARGIRRVMAVIGDSANAASIGLHTALGFERAGVIPACGWKFGRWLDIVLMQRSLGWGDRTPPDEEAPAGDGAAAAP
ncbi:Phosphinothricin N-acetyltransferase [Tepidimonas sediminis]|uniref:Phosphinothricin N-acetyltransferase n=1 Tax=Tepidimonas sediminis TaxID=2588941 RepID=A0A554WP01_9BURK|nr:GNAT family N-acetyltransferase [Tepidimonas sediminis]TSE25299.1 Phosphinothricin N-acetyltransferase [Tepidimonas sediminis]